MAFSQNINSQHPIIRFTVQRDVNHRLPFLDVFTDKNIPEFPFTSVYGKSTYNGLLTIKHLTLTNLGLVRTLVGKTFRIITPWTVSITTGKELTDVSTNILHSYKKALEISDNTKVTPADQNRGEHLHVW